jgi:hypothetical protein
MNLTNEHTLLFWGQKDRRQRHTKNEGKKRQQCAKKEFNDHGGGEESGPDPSRLPSCHFPLEEFGRGRLSCGHLSWGLDSSSYQGTYFFSSYHGHPYLSPCPCPYLFPCPYPYRLSQIVDEGCENARDRGQSDEKAAPEGEYACRSAKQRRADSWPTERMLTKVVHNIVGFHYLNT